MIESLPNDDLARRLNDDELFEQAFAEATRVALERHRQAGLPIAEWREGKVVWVSAEQLEGSDGRGESIPDVLTQGIAEPPSGVG